MVTCQDRRTTFPQKSYGCDLSVTKSKKSQFTRRLYDRTERKTDTKELTTTPTHRKVHKQLIDLKEDTELMSIGNWEQDNTPNRQQKGNCQYIKRL